MTKTDDYLRIMFKTPTTSSADDFFKDPNADFIREVHKRFPFSSLDFFVKYVNFLFIGHLPYPKRCKFEQCASPDQRAEEARHCSRDGAGDESVAQGMSLLNH